MNATDNAANNEDRTSKTFQAECFGEATGFLQEMQERHGGLTYARIFQYVAALHAVMMDIHLQLEEMVDEERAQTKEK